MINLSKFSLANLERIQEVLRTVLDELEIQGVNRLAGNKIPIEKIEKLVREFFPIIPRDIIQTLNLLRPIFKKTAAYGHFGRSDPDFTWERTDKAKLLKKEAGI